MLNNNCNDFKKNTQMDTNQIFDRPLPGHDEVGDGLRAIGGDVAHRNGASGVVR